MSSEAGGRCKLHASQYSWQQNVSEQQNKAGFIVLCFGGVLHLLVTEDRLIYAPKNRKMLVFCKMSLLKSMKSEQNTGPIQFTMKLWTFLATLTALYSFCCNFPLILFFFMVVIVRHQNVSHLNWCYIAVTVKPKMFCHGCTILSDSTSLFYIFVY